PVRAPRTACSPQRVATRGERTASNAVAANIENVVCFMGPAIGALMIGAFDVAAVVWLNVASFLWSFAMVAGVKARAAAEPTSGVDEPEEGMLREMTAGFAYLGKDRDLRTV